MPLCNQSVQDPPAVDLLLEGLAQALRRRHAAPTSLALRFFASGLKFRRTDNVLIYFDKPLQARVHGLFYDSLANFGILVLGSKESLRFSPYEDNYEQINGPEKIFRKVR